MNSAVRFAIRRATARARPGFPWGAPTLPGGVTPLPVERRTGVDFDTDWARRTPARYARGVLVEYGLRPVVGVVASPRVHGSDRIGGLEGPAIFAANHRSHLDTPVLLSTLPARFRHRTVVAAAADYFFDTRVKGVASALVMSAIPMERLRVGRRSADLAAQLIGEGWSLVIFPEGGRSPDGWGQEFRGGAGYLSVRCGVPVVPVHIEGTRRIMRKGSNRITPSTVDVTFGSPMRPDGGEDARRFSARVERAVAALADERTTDWWAARRNAARGATPPLTGPDDVGSWRRQWALGAARPAREAGRTWP